MLYSLKSRLMLAFILILLLSFGTMSYILFGQAKSIIRSYIETSALEKMDEYGSFVNMAHSQVYDISSLLFNSEATQSWDHVLSDPASPHGEKMLSNIAMSKFLLRTANNYSIVSSVTLYREDGTWVNSDQQIGEDQSFLLEDWYLNFKLRSKQWMSAHTDPMEVARSNLKPVVSLLLPIGTFQPASSRSVLKVNVSSEYLLEPLSHIHLGDHSTIYLLDQNGEPILDQHDYLSQENSVRKMKDMDLSYQSKGVVYLKNDKGENEILVYKKLKLNHWMLVSVVSEEELFSGLIKLRNSIIIFTVILLLCSIIIATVLSHSITKPLSSLASAMRFVQKGDFTKAESRISERDIPNEVGFVTSTFRNMIEQLRQHIKTEFELKLLRQQAEYKALLMQINPHFLFNTLELLSSLSMQNRTDDTLKVIDSLGKMMRFSLRITEDIVPLQEELKYVRYYIAVLQIRSGERLNISIHEEGDISERKIVKFILQPLIENAVKYSFVERNEAEVNISIRCDHDRITLSVSDSGPGMSLELIEELNEQSRKVQLHHVLDTGNRQIGLRNVLARCQLYYGTAFTFNIESSINGGTHIELILPVQEGDQHVSRINSG